MQLCLCLTPTQLMTWYPNAHVKISAPVLCEIRALIFNDSLSSGGFLSSTVRKRAPAVPIYKKSNNIDVSNYRPISLLPLISRFFEKLANQQLQCPKNSESQFDTQNCLGCYTKLNLESKFHAEVATYLSHLEFKILYILIIIL